MAAGIIKEIPKELPLEERTYYTAQDVMLLLGVSRDKAYKMLRIMKQECVEAGILHKTYPPGKIPKNYFNKQCMIDE